jgi:hypothetical protein
MVVTVESLPAKICSGLAAGLMFLALSTVVVRTYAAWRISRKPTVEALRKAISLDPTNADYQLALGRLYLYNIPDIDFGKAILHFSEAVRLNPQDPQAWLEMGAALNQEGNVEEAEVCLRQADKLAPHSPPYQWSIANFFLLQGNIDETFRHFNVILQGTGLYDEWIFDTAWKASGDPKKILSEVVPHSLVKEFEYLDYLIRHQHLADTHDVWERIAGESETYSPNRAALYFDSLIGAKQLRDAERVWNDLLRKNVIHAQYTRQESNLLLNGSFEEDFLNMGFDWRISSTDGVAAGRDQTTFHSPGHSLIVLFDAKQNVFSRNVWQFVPVKPGHAYRLRGFIKTEGITTDSGPRIEVRDAYDAHLLEKFSEDVTGSSMGWVPLTLEFTASPKTQLIIVSITRFPSGKLDNLIQGKAWADDLSMEEELTRESGTKP